ncbi:MAG TPA: hypothetical protein VGC44_10905, partial [Longimicrobiales bacterium]
MTRRKGDRKRAPVQALVEDAAEEPPPTGPDAEPGVDASAAAESAHASYDRRFHGARLAERSGDIEDAIARYRELLRESPNDVRARNNLGC